MQETLDEGRGLIVGGRVADASGRCEQRRPTQNQQRREQYRGDELANAINQLARVQGEKKYGSEIGDAVEEQGQSTCAGKGRHAHLEGHHGGSRCSEQRADGQIHGNGQEHAGTLAERCGEAIHAAAHTGQGDHGQ
ncbi:hypothetical protein D3C72_1894620 [compost metagenome]